MKKKIVNGLGKIIEGKYVASKEDGINSLRIVKMIEVFVKRLIKQQFGDVHKSKEFRTKYDKLLQQASAYIWTPTIHIDSPNFRANEGAFIHVNTGNNSNGYNNIEFKRHVVISFELKGSVRYKYQKRWNKDCTIIKKYILSDTIEDACKEFESWLLYEYPKFFKNRVHLNIAYQEGYLNP